MDANTTVYEWNYTRQMLQIRLPEASGEINEQGAMKEIFGTRKYGHIIAIYGFN